MHTGLGELALKLATFCVNNHALVVGIDEQMVDPRHPPGMGGPKVWGAAVPTHTLPGEVG